MGRGDRAPTGARTDAVPRPLQQNLRVAFLLDITVYQQLLEAIKAYDEAKAPGEQPIPLEDALRSIEESRS